MNPLKNKKLYILIVIIILLLTYLSLMYFNFVQEKRNNLQVLKYEKQASIMRDRVSQMIYLKQKATVAIGLSLVNDKQLLLDIKNHKITSSYYTNLINSFKKDTQYQNIWIHIIDADLHSLYRSWTDKTGDDLTEIRKDLAEVLETQKVIYSISYGEFSFTIKAIIPIIQGGKSVGVLELISHFNSISKAMQKFNVDSIVLLDKEYTKALRDPFTKKFIDDYYIANFDVTPYILQHLQKHGVAEHFISGYMIDDNHILTSYPLLSFDGEQLGYYVMFKELENISSLDTDFFMFKWLAFGLIVVLVLAGVVNLILFYFIVKQKRYYKKIIDSSTNIVVINHHNNIVDVNQVFFKYFTFAKNISEFKNKHNCICDFFVEEDGYITKKMGDIYWVDYLLIHTEETNKVKISYEDKIYYFSVSASLVLKEKDFYSVVFSDITKEETYKIELENLTITDVLTSIGNRRYFHQKINEKIASAHRYLHPLSFIMMDIDFFKAVNDKYGHSTGDEVLVEYTRLISTMIRDGDVFCRIGGEEFIIILPHVDKETVHKIAEKIRVKIENHKAILPITMSFGVTQYIQGEDETHILKRVDKALYLAKESGRNRVVSK